MGCDIHGWIEIVKYPMIREDKKTWYAVVDIDRWQRNYLVFARIFGVRNDYNVEPIAANRGIPDAGLHDDNDDWRAKDLAYWKDDGHSYSWINYKEFQENFEKITAPYEGYTDFSRWAVLCDMMHLLSTIYGEDNVRLVVWFDN